MSEKVLRHSQVQQVTFGSTNLTEQTGVTDADGNYIFVRTALVEMSGEFEWAFSLDDDTVEAIERLLLVAARKYLEELP